MKTIRVIILSISFLLLTACSAINKISSDVDLEVAKHVIISPEGDNIPVTAQLLLQFHSGYPSNLITQDHQLSLPIEIKPEISCFWRRVDQRTLSCERRTQDWLESNTQYSVTIQPGWKDVAGRVINDDIKQTFTTLTPLVEYSRVREHPTPVDPILSLRFSEPVDIEAIINELYIIDNKNNRYPVSFVEYVSEINELRIKSRKPLPIQEGLRLMVSDNVRLKYPVNNGNDNNKIALTFDTYGDLYFKGVYCRINHGHSYSHVKYSPDIGQACAPDSIELRFNSIVSAEEFNKYLIVEQNGSPYILKSPPNYYQSTRLPELDYGGLYEIRFKAGELHDIFGHALRKDIDISIKTLNYPPTLVYRRSNYVLEENLNTDLAIEVVNLTKPIEVMWHGADKIQHKKSIMPEAGHLNKLQRISLGLRDHINSDRLSVEIHSDELEENRATRKVYAQVSPFNIHWQRTSKGSLIWVSYLDSAEPANNALIELYQGNIESDSAQHLVSATTDENGLVLIRHDELGVEDKQQDFYIVATKGEERGYFEINSRNIRCWFCDNAFADHTYADNLLFAVHSQPFYQPGELAQIKIFNRQVSPGKLELLTSGNYQVSFSNINSEPIPGIPVIPVTWSKYGTAAFEFKIPEKINDDYIQVNLVSDGDDSSGNITGLRVVPFNKSTFQISTSIHEGSAEQNDSRIVLHSNLYSGTPYAGAAARVIAEFQAERYSYADYQIDSVAHGTDKFSFEILNAQGETDSNGQYSVPFSINRDQYYVGEIAVESSVLDAAGRRISSQQNIPWHSRDRYVGLNIDESQLYAGNNLKIRSIVVDADEALVTGTQINIEIFRDIEKARLPELARWESISTCQILSQQEFASCIITLKTEGYYKFVASIVDTKGEVHQTQLIKYVKSASLNINRPEAIVSKLTGPATAKIGEIITLTLDTPIKSGAMLLTISNTEIIDYQLIPDINQHKSVVIPVTDAMAPAYNVRVDIFRPRTGVLTPQELSNAGYDIHRPQMSTAQHHINIIESDKNIPISVASDKKIYTPGDRVNITVQNIDRRGLSSEFALLVIDQSLLDLMKDSIRMYDLSYMYSYLRSYLTQIHNFGYSLADNLTGMQIFGIIGDVRDDASLDAMVMMDAAGFAGSLEEIVVTAQRREGSGSEDEFRNDFRNVALWLPQFELEGGESRDISFILPDNLTSWKAIVFAVDDSYRYGMANTDFTTSKTLRVDSALPNQLVVSDNLNAQFTVTNTQEIEVAASVAAVATNAVSSAELGGMQEEIMLEPHRPITVTMPVTAIQKGVGHFAVTAQSVEQEFHDAIELNIPVYSNTVRQYDVLRERLTERRGIKYQFSIPGTALPDSALVKMTYSQDGLDLIANAIHYNRTYPHECWEQRLSRAVSAAIYNNIADNIEDIEPWPEATSTFVQDVINEAGGFQADNGGMVFFVADDMYSNPYLTAYTLIAFNWLKDMGYAVPELVELRAAKYLAEYYRKGKKDYQYWPTTIALPLLIKSGFADTELLNQLASQIQPDNHDGHVYLYQAMLYAKNTELLSEYQSKFEKIIEHGAYRDQGEYNLPLLSTAVTQCSLVTAILEDQETTSSFRKILPSMIASIRSNIRNKNHWRTTQENIFCAKALMDYRHVTRTSEPLLIHGSLNDTPLEKVRIDGLQTSLFTYETKLTDIYTLDLQIAAEGTGEVDFRAVVSFEQPVDIYQKENEGFFIQRTYQVKRDNAWVNINEKVQLKKSDLVKVVIDLVVPADRNMVALTDPIPAGLEIVNDMFATTSQADIDNAFSIEESYYKYYFYHHAIRNDSMNYYAEWLPAGNYKISYLAQVIAQGEFTALPPRVEEMYQPEVYGTGNSSTVFVNGSL